MIRIKLYEGIRVDNNDNLIFNWNYDDKNKDCLYLDGLEAKQFNDQGIRYIYAYNYSDNASQRDKKIIRQYLKSKQGFQDDHVRDLVDNGILKLSAVKHLSSFGAIINIKSSKPHSLTNLMHSYLTEYGANKYVDFELVKQTYDKVTIDYILMEEELNKLHWDSIRIEDFINDFKDTFEIWKQKGFLFEMKKLVPSKIRSAFTNFLKFETEEQKRLYEQLQDVDVLIYDDFLTSGSTVKEVIRYLKGINPNNTLTIFILINQQP